jgi:hypothetical protein
MSDVSLTLFNSIFDNKTDKRMALSNFLEFESLLYKLSEIPRQSKRDSHLISPACYKEGTNRRCNDNVSHWSAWAAMDVDDHDFSSENLENELASRFGHYNYVCYSTASSRSDHPKFRLVFPLSSTVESHSIRHFWYALNRELGHLGDPQTKDLSRMYYIPATYAGAYNFIFSHKSGSDIDPSDLMRKHEYVETRSTAKSFLDRLPEAMQKEILQYRKDSMERSTNVRWSGYRDCPFVNKNLIQDYKAIAYIDNSGRYAMIYKIMVSIATNAVRDGYAITTKEIVDLIRELDMETSQRYAHRRLDIEADRALEFAYRNL